MVIKRDWSADEAFKATAEIRIEVRFDFRAASIIKGM